MPMEKQWMSKHAVSKTTSADRKIKSPCYAGSYKPTAGRTSLDLETSQSASAKAVSTNTPTANYKAKRSASVGGPLEFKAPFADAKSKKTAVASEVAAPADDCDPETKKLLAIFSSPTRSTRSSAIVNKASAAPSVLINKASVNPRTATVGHASAQVSNAVFSSLKQRVEPPTPPDFASASAPATSSSAIPYDEFEFVASQVPQQQARKKSRKQADEKAAMPTRASAKRKPSRFAVKGTKALTREPSKSLLQNPRRKRSSSTQRVQFNKKVVGEQFGGSLTDETETGSCMDEPIDRRKLREVFTIDLKGSSDEEDRAADRNSDLAVAADELSSSSNGARNAVETSVGSCKPNRSKYASANDIWIAEQTSPKKTAPVKTYGKPKGPSATAGGNKRKLSPSSTSTLRTKPRLGDTRPNTLNVAPYNNPFDIAAADDDAPSKKKPRKSSKPSKIPCSSADFTASQEIKLNNLAQSFQAADDSPLLIQSQDREYGVTDLNSVAKSKSMHRQLLEACDSDDEGCRQRVLYVGSRALTNRRAQTFSQGFFEEAPLSQSPIAELLSQHPNGREIENETMTQASFPSSLSYLPPMPLRGNGQISTSQPSLRRPPDASFDAPDVPVFHSQLKAKASCLISPLKMAAPMSAVAAAIMVIAPALIPSPAQPHVDLKADKNLMKKPNDRGIETDEFGLDRSLQEDEDDDVDMSHENNADENDDVLADKASPESDSCILSETSGRHSAAPEMNDSRSMDLFPDVENPVASVENEANALDNGPNDVDEHNEHDEGEADANGDMDCVDQNRVGASPKLQDVDVAAVIDQPNASCSVDDIIDMDITSSQLAKTVSPTKLSEMLKRTYTLEARLTRALELQNNAIAPAEPTAPVSSTPLKNAPMFPVVQAIPGTPVAAAAPASESVSPDVVPSSIQKLPTPKEEKASPDKSSSSRRRSNRLKRSLDQSFQQVAADSAANTLSQTSNAETSAIISSTESAIVGSEEELRHSASAGQDIQAEAAVAAMHGATQSSTGFANAATGFGVTKQLSDRASNNAVSDLTDSQMLLLTSQEERSTCVVDDEVSDSQLALVSSRPPSSQLSQNEQLAKCSTADRNSPDLVASSLPGASGNLPAGLDSLRPEANVVSRRGRSSQRRGGGAQGYSKELKTYPLRGRSQSSSERSSASTERSGFAPSDVGSDAVFSEREPADETAQATIAKRGRKKTSDRSSAVNSVAAGPLRRSQRFQLDSVAAEDQKTRRDYVPDNVQSQSLLVPLITVNDGALAVPTDGANLRAVDNPNMIVGADGAENDGHDSKHNALPIALVVPAAQIETDAGCNQFDQTISDDELLQVSSQPTDATVNSLGFAKANNSSSSSRTNVLSLAIHSRSVDVNLKEENQFPATVLDSDKKSYTHTDAKSSFNQASERLNEDRNVVVDANQLMQLKTGLGRLQNPLRRSSDAGFARSPLVSSSLSSFVGGNNARLNVAAAFSMTTSANALSAVGHKSLQLLKAQRSGQPLAQPSDFLFLTSDLTTKSDRAVVQEFAAKWKIRITKEYQCGVTHLFMTSVRRRDAEPPRGPDDVGDIDGRLARRTAKLFQAVAGKAFIMSAQYAHQCLESNDILAEEKHEMLGDVGLSYTGGLQASRRDPNGVFDGWRIVCQTHSDNFSREELSELLRSTGAQVFDDAADVGEVDERCALIGSLADVGIDYNAMFRRTGLPPLDREWVFDSILAHQLQPMSGAFLLCDGELLSSRRPISANDSREK